MAQSPKFNQKDAAEGQYASSPACRKSNCFALPDLAHKKKFNSEHPGSAQKSYTYDAVKAMVEAMKRASSAELAKYLPELAKTDMQGNKSGPIKV